MNAVRAAYPAIVQLYLVTRPYVDFGHTNSALCRPCR
ncbi:hypothetical protein Caci_3790 [Catenulispora acidiphila DSM 44928]|uniref:Uncharacterized protein n=1 Tax=Catenulispora acidiphila (strain DSM 44928 / JCM 14897 / NBRC 102108 / NRRL B-24433 / ID139908) TaxID=479433 RepID=C7QD99_CATAD|nr:hypothetical protein Caci_3790 [Catenulispora acidiphila DSM 44928]